MGADTKIEWADATVNVWEGCTKVSPACKNCYAETNSPVRAMEMRIGEALQVEPSADGKRRLKMWGVHGFRYETTNWEGQLRALNRKARENRQLIAAGNMVGVQVKHDRPRVFINSLSDIFEDWLGPVYRLEDGKPVVVAQSLDDVRTRFFRVAEECTELDLLLVTKRPENVLRMAPLHWGDTGIWRFHAVHKSVETGPQWPSHIWIGTTVEDQEHADKRIPELLKVPAKVRFLSVEPLLGPVVLPIDPPRVQMIDWVIVGGESGKNARPMHPDWVRSIRDQCQVAGVPFFFKQWGEWLPLYEDVYGANPNNASALATKNGCLLSINGNANIFNGSKTAYMRKVGKKNAGRVLDGRTWDEVPR